jgi:hypothetical protein
MKLLGVTVCLALFICVVWGSSHSEAPTTARFPQADNTDLYAFRSYESGRDNFAVFIMDVSPLQVPYGGPNYFALSDQHFYEIYIDQDGDGVEDLTLQFFYGATLGGNLINTTVDLDVNDCNNPTVPGFKIQRGGIELPIGNQMVPIALKAIGSIRVGDNSNLNWHEQYYLNLIQGPRTSGTSTPLTHDGGDDVFIKPWDNAGEKTFPDGYELYAQQYFYNLDDITPCGSNGAGGRVFVGQRIEPFSVNLGRVFDLINLVPIPGFPGAVTDDPANNIIGNRSITAFVVEMPIACLTSAGNGEVVGVWSGIRELIHNPDGSHVAGKQVSRLGMPLVNELVIGLPRKDEFNAGSPPTDVLFADFVLLPTLPELVSSIFLTTVNSVLGVNLTTLAPSKPRLDLFTVFLTGVPGLNQQAESVTTPSEQLRINFTVAPVAADTQSRYGVLGGDLAGFPNGRRPGDDVVDIALRVVMGALCDPNVAAFNCTAPVGTVEFLDGAPCFATDSTHFLLGFPWLGTPLPGATSSGSGGSSPASKETGVFASIKDLFV